MSSSEGVRTIDRFGSILNCFSEDEPFLTLSQISERLGLAKSTTHRLLTSMRQNGFLSRTPDTRAYYLGHQFMYWASIVESVFDLKDLARPFLEELNRITGETAILTVLEDGWAVCLEKKESKKTVRLAMPIGKRRWPHAGASAKILMAYMNSDEIEDTVSRSDLPRFMHNTIVDPQALRTELERVRELGYATSFEETDLGTMGVAAPIIDRSGKVIAGIGIACPISRCSEDSKTEMTQVVTDAARRFSTQLGWTDS